MSEKAPWGLGNLFGKAAVKPLSTSVLKCPSGKHAMSAGWNKCPYCEADRNAGEKTRINIDDGPAAPAPSSSARPGPTRINTIIGAPDEVEHVDLSHRETKMLPEAAESGFGRPRASASGAGEARGATRVLDMDEPSAPRRANAARRLTGIVVTFSGSSLGRLYEVHEGRNYGGSGRVAAEGNRECDFLIEDDSTLSSTHFLILCQGGKYRISDCNSTNGTYVEGELIDPLGIELIDGARIQAGATLLQFKKVLPPTPVTPVTIPT